jgi:hypothetical protein
MPWLKRQVKSALGGIISCNYHMKHRGTALRLLKNIEAVKGRTDPELIRRADRYAREMLGWIGYAPWLYVYSAVAGSFKEGWIPDNYYGKVVVPAIKGAYGEVSNLKPLTSMVFAGSRLPDLGYYVNGLWFSKDREVLSGSKIKEAVFHKTHKVVYKVDESLQGRGVYIFNEIDFDPKLIQRLGNGVIQKYIVQHPFFDELMPVSVATIRITTVLEDTGKYSVRAAYLRLGRQADTHVRSASHIRIPIDLKKGELDELGFTPDWTTINRHPDTQSVFAGRVVPGFQQCLTTALDLHKCMPYARCIGWDMVVDREDSVNVMEWNGSHNDIKFSEAIQGPCFTNLGWESLWKAPSVDV